MSLAINVYISLGSNSPDRLECLAKARERLAGLPNARVARFSAIYHTEPQDYADQPWFANQATKIEAENCWTPRAFLEALLQIEADLGRIRNPGARFGPRNIDLDLLLFGDASSQDPLCILPHPRLLQRAFVLAPLREVEPDLQIFGKKLPEWLGRLDWRLEGSKIFQKQ